MLIGDTRQHQGVDAGKPFEQLQHAGMRTAQLDQIVRQKDPELLAAVEHLSKNETETGRRAAATSRAALPRSPTRSSASRPSRRATPQARKTRLIVSPDNASRRDINQAVRAELQAHGTVAEE